MTRPAPASRGRAGPVTHATLLRTYLGPQRAKVALMAVLLAGSIALEISEPQIVALFIRSVQLGSPEGELIGVALLFIGIALARQATLVVAAHASERVSWTATNAAREDLTAHVLGLDMSFHESRSPGDLIERIDGDVNEVAEFFSSLVVQLLGNALLILGILGALTVIDWRIGLTFAAVTVAGFVVLGRVAGIATGRWEDDREQSARFFGSVSETIRATEDLRSSAATGYAMARFHGHLRSWLPVKIRAEAWGSAIWVVMSLVFTAGTAFAFGYGGFFFQDGTLSLPGVYLVVAYATMLTAPMEALRQQVQGLQQASAAIRRIGALFAHRPTLVDGSLALPPGALSVRFDRVAFAYPRAGGDGPDARVLDGLSFDVPAGSTLGLVGRTGAGKSTIAHLLSRMYDPVAGRVLLGGVDTREARLRSLRSRVGYVTQDVHLFDATLRENLTFFDDTVGDDRLLAILDALDLRPWLDGLPAGLSTPVSAGGLSSGQAQLLALARVFLRDPGLIVLDEPSSRLDPATEAMVERALDRLLAGRTLIVIAHRLDTIRRADRVIVLDDGRVIEQGDTADLLDDPGSRFAELSRVGTVLR